MPELIDLSSFNQVTSFSNLRAAGIRGVWLKATEGATYDASRYYERYRDAQKAGLRVGAYHFARSDHNAPEVEADHFARIVRSIGRRDLRPVLDLEKPLANASWARQFNQRVKTLLGVIPAFYSYPAEITSLHATVPIGNGLWLAAYGPNDGTRHPVTAPYPWKRYIAHQYTSRGHVPGIVGYVDRTYAPRLRGVLAHPLLGLL